MKKLKIETKSDNNFIGAWQSENLDLMDQIIEEGLVIHPYQLIQHLNLANKTQKSYGPTLKIILRIIEAAQEDMLFKNFREKTATQLSNLLLL